MVRLETAFLRRLSAQPVTRFAPSPTGFLHLGHVASALYVWGVARAVGARVLLRIEDHDTTRCRPQFEAAIFADLAWLGLVPENLAAAHWVAGASEFRQSDQRARYAAAIAALGKAHHVYACDCSRKRILAAQQGAQQGAYSPEDDEHELRYDGHCRLRGLDPQARDIGIRLQLGSATVTFVDGLLGEQRQTPAAQCGDLLLRDRHDCYTYQLAVVVDDLRHGVDLVVRGQDLTASSGRQLILGRLLGSTKEPVFWHHPLLRGPDGRKLGKRFFSAGVASRREAGEDAAVIRGEAAALAGIIPAARPMAVDEVLEMFRRE